MNDFDQIAEIELEHINYPETDWIGSQDSYDVVIIGAGMAGLASAFALKRLGISNIALFDEADAGKEGPWTTYARMLTLRSTKDLVGPALDIPALTFRTWFECQFGEAKWNELYKIPTCEWKRYLDSFQKALKLSVNNNSKVSLIEPLEKGIGLVINGRQIKSKKVVLATGRMGFGGLHIPEFAKSISSRSAHTSHPIDFLSLKGKKVGIIGAGASGFDAAATALENGSSQVDILLRRPEIPNVNKAATLTYSGFTEGYYHLDDEKRWVLMFECFKDGIPPPQEAITRVQGDSRFGVKKGVTIDTAEIADSQVLLKTNQGALGYDFLILGTGFEVDGNKQPELSGIIDDIQLWKDRKISSKGPNWFKRCPYLGPHFQFLEKTSGQATYLKDIYCFNYAAVLSHGLTSSDIPGIGAGALRLARGIASDFFTENWEKYHHQLKTYQNKEF